MISVNTEQPLFRFQEVHFSFLCLSSSLYRPLSPLFLSLSYFPSKEHSVFLEHSILLLHTGHLLLVIESASRPLHTPSKHVTSLPRKTLISSAPKEIIYGCPFSQTFRVPPSDSILHHDFPLLMKSSQPPWSGL